MWILNNVACGNDYTQAATIAWLYGSSGGYAAVRDNDTFCSLAWGNLGDEQWTPEFRMAPGNLALSPGIIGIRFRNATAGQVANITAVLSSHDEPPVFLTAAGVAGSGGGGTLVTTDGVITVSPTNTLFIGSGIVLTNPSPSEARLDATGVAGVSGLLATWTGLMPPVAGNGTERRVPFDPSGASLTFTLNSCWARVGSAGSFTSGWRLEKSPGGNSAFVPTTITSLSITAGNFENTAGAFSSSVSSGDVLRVVYTNVGSPILFHLQLEGHV